MIIITFVALWESWLIAQSWKRFAYKSRDCSGVDKMLVVYYEIRKYRMYISLFSHQLMVQLCCSLRWDIHELQADIE